MSSASEIPLDPDDIVTKINRRIAWASELFLLLVFVCTNLAS